MRVRRGARGTLRQSQARKSASASNANIAAALPDGMARVPSSAERPARLSPIRGASSGAGSNGNARCPRQSAKTDAANPAGRSARQRPSVANAATVERTRASAAMRSAPWAPPTGSSTAPRSIHLAAVARALNPAQPTIQRVACRASQSVAAAASLGSKLMPRCAPAAWCVRAQRAATIAAARSAQSAVK